MISATEARVLSEAEDYIHLPEIEEKIEKIIRAACVRGLRSVVITPMQIFVNDHGPWRKCIPVLIKNLKKQGYKAKCPGWGNRAYFASGKINIKW